MQETTLSAEVYQAAALTKPQADKLFSLYQSYKLEVNRLAKKQEALTSTLCMNPPQLDMLGTEDLRMQRAGSDAAARPLPAGSEATGSTVPGAAASVEGAPPFQCCLGRATVVENASC
jgi:hypothetical protein